MSIPLKLDWQYWYETAPKCVGLMAYDCRVYRILIASPSDVEEERDIVVRAIQDWNDLHSYNRKVVLLPLRWETHTAPEYGIRPQAVINRSIVDDCDLVVGIFWTRLGSPTGEADSGTLEEIDRAGKAGKQIMLYFSKVSIDPDELDIEQVQKLKEYKTATYPNALVEAYRTRNDFRDKFMRHLEMKVRDLQRNDSTSLPPLELSFVSEKDSELVGDSTKVSLVRPQISDFKEVTSALGKDKAAAFRSRLERQVRKLLTVPMILAIRNSGTSTIRDTYVEVLLAPSSSDIKISNRSVTEEDVLLARYYGKGESDDDEARPQLDRLRSSGLVKLDEKWKLSFECGSIQPDRVRLVEPILFITAESSGVIDIETTVYADSFPTPVKCFAQFEVALKDTPMSVRDVMKDCDAYLTRLSKADNIMFYSGTDASEILNTKWILPTSGGVKKRSGPKKPNNDPQKG